MENGETIDHEAPRHIYMQLADIIERQIETGRLKPGARLLSEVDLAEQYGVSRLTARRAVKELRRRGLVVTLTGRGSFVKPG